MKVSITLPSIYPEALDRALQNIEATTRTDHEVIVVSPFRVDRSNVVWVEEKERRGCNFAHDMAARKATGDFITAFVDDVLYVDDWDERIISDFIEREKILDGNNVLGLRFSGQRHVGTVFGIYYPYFPFMRRSNLQKFGWLGPEYRLGFGDADLGMRVWHRGGRCEFSRESVLIVTEDDRRKGETLFAPEDLVLFTSRWANVYGRDWKIAALRDFNLDVVPEDIPNALAERTIFHNRPDFREVAFGAPPQKTSGKQSAFGRFRRQWFSVLGHRKIRRE
jgi:glycosyltransferase involved in cell wall biosynthesis